LAGNASVWEDRLMRDVVLYVGGFGLPDRTASALRALGNAAVLRAAGYQVLIAGKFTQIPPPQSQPVQVHGFDCHDIRQPLPGLPVVDYTVSPANIRALALHIGVGRVAAIMAYNYPGFGLHRLLQLGCGLGIPVINETTEWYGWEGFRPLTNARRMLESRWRNGSLVARAGNLVSATHWTRNRHPNVNALILPFALDPAWDCWQADVNDAWCRDSDAVRLVYSGSPGIGMKKDRLPLIVEALDRLNPDGQGFRFAVVGMTKHDYLRSMPRHAALLERHAGSIRFQGRMPHRDAVGVLKAADFSIFVREPNRVSDVGFPTKYAEAATCGIPVLTNRTSDIAEYLIDGQNGILLPDCGATSMEQGLGRALTMSRGELDRMHSSAADEKSFEPAAWVPRMQDFMRELRMPR
jgi:glycosyltransferase involved in cell wall biosynthesis